jgi:membrane protease YdiL (CAAX protease family)
VRLLGGRKWTAIVITGVVFALLHVTNPNASIVSAIGNGLGGVIYGIAFLGGRNIWLPWGLHFGWNIAQVMLGFPLSGQAFSGILLQEFVPGSDALTGGAFGPEAGAFGIASRFLIMALVLGYLKLRAGGRGSVRTLEFPITVYDNPSRTHAAS